MLLYGQLELGYRDVGRPCKRYNDCLKRNLRTCEIDTVTWEAHAQDRSLWKLSCNKGLEVFEHQRAEAIHASKARRKQSSYAEALFLCSTCGRSCASRIYLFLHLRTHREEHT